MTETLFGAAHIASVTAKAESGLLAAMEWMPYASDVEGDARTLLALALERVNIALGVVRETRDEAERRIVVEATAE